MEQEIPIFDEENCIFLCVYVCSQAEVRQHKTNKIKQNVFVQIYKYFLSFSYFQFYFANIFAIILCIRFWPSEIPCPWKYSWQLRKKNYSIDWGQSSFEKLHSELLLFEKKKKRWTTVMREKNVNIKSPHETFRLIWTFIWTLCTALLQSQRQPVWNAEWSQPNVNDIILYFHWNHFSRYYTFDMQFPCELPSKLPIVPCGFHGFISREKWFCGREKKEQ